MKNKFYGIIVLVIILVLSSCKDKVEEESVFNESNLIGIANSLVAEINNNNSQAILDKSNEVISNTYTSEMLNEYIEAQLSKTESYDEIIKTTFSESKHPLKKYPIALIEVLARFENGTMRYSFNFNESEEIIGFFMSFQLK